MRKSWLRKATQEDRTHYDFLEGLRGIAILLVLFSHSSNAGMNVIPFLDMGGSGKFGVWLFFVLSAFLLTRKTLIPLREKNFGYLIRYFVARVFRIFPLYIIILFAYLFFGLMDFSTVLKHIFLARGDGVFWAIPVEFSYYLIIPIAVFSYIFVFRGHLWRFTLFFSALCILLWIYYPPTLARTSSTLLWPYLSIFGAGTIAALVVDKYDKIPRLFLILVPILFSIILITVPANLSLIFSLFDFPPVPRDGLHSFAPVYGVIWAVIILGIYFNIEKGKVFSLSVFRFSGRVSFSLYLLHITVLLYVSNMSFIPLEFRGGIFIAATFVFASLSYMLVERPFIQVGRKIGQQLSHRFRTQIA